MVTYTRSIQTLTIPVQEGKKAATPLICVFLSPQQLSAGKVKIRLLKDEPLAGEYSGLSCALPAPGTLYTAVY